MRTLYQDICYGFRMLWKRPGGTIVIICTLGLVIGALSLVLGVKRHERSTRLPFPDADHLVRLWRISKQTQGDIFPASVYAELRRQVQGLESMAVLGSSGSYVLTGRGEPMSLYGQRVTASVFKVTNVQPVLGRTFSPEEEQTGEEHLVVLSYETWQTVFDRAESIIGDSIRLNEEPYTIVGVMPKGYGQNVLFYGIDIWLPRNFGSPARAGDWRPIIGRRKKGVTQSQLQAELDVIVTPILKAYAASQNRTR
ncbi:MAG: ABC transporter permease, partial [Phycisphaerales bacterium]